MNNSGEYGERNALSGTLLSNEPVPTPSVKHRLKQVAGEVADALIVRDVAWIMGIGESEIIELDGTTDNQLNADSMKPDAHLEVLVAIRRLLGEASADELLFFNVSRALGVMVKFVGSDPYQASKLERDLDLSTSCSQDTLKASLAILADLHRLNALAQLHKRREELASTASSSDSTDVPPEIAKLLQVPTLSAL
jgi:hypothetical protein